MNSICTALAAIGVFILVWYAMLRDDKRAVQPLRETRPETWLGLPRMAWEIVGWLGAPLAGASLWAIAEHALRTQSWPAWTLMLSVPALFIILVASARSWPAPYRYWGCGLIAALLVWFNAAILIDTHAFPQWDMWLMPTFLIALLAALGGWWLPAGFMLAIGTMAKGQMIAMVPLFVLWPIFEGHPRRALRVLAGFICGAALVVAPWLLRDHVARYFVLASLGIMAILAPWFFLVQSSGFSLFRRKAATTPGTTLDLLHDDKIETEADLATLINPQPPAPPTRRWWTLAFPAHRRAGTHPALVVQHPPGAGDGPVAGRGPERGAAADAVDRPDALDPDLGLPGPGHLHLPRRPAAQRGFLVVHGRV